MSKTNTLPLCLLHRTYYSLNNVYAVTHMHWHICRKSSPHACIGLILEFLLLWCRFSRSFHWHILIPFHILIYYSPFPFQSQLFYSWAWRWEGTRSMGICLLLHKICRCVWIKSFRKKLGIYSPLLMCLRNYFFFPNSVCRF